MAQEYRTKVFKSGNSTALRIPKELGLAAGEELVIVSHQNGQFSMWRKQDTKEMFLALAGSMSPGFMKGGRGDIEQGPRAWDRPTNRDAA